MPQVVKHSQGGRLPAFPGGMLREAFEAASGAATTEFRKVLGENRDRRGEHLGPIMVPGSCELRLRLYPTEPSVRIVPHAQSVSEWYRNGRFRPFTDLHNGTAPIVIERISTTSDIRASIA